MSDTLSVSVQRIISSRPHWLLAGMLLSLHGTLAWGVQVWWSYAALLVHFGLFLLWQPLWRSERKLSFLHLLLVLGCGAVLFLFWHSWWLATLWLGVVVGLVRGDVVGMDGRRQRMGHLFALLYLLSMLLLWVVPHLFSDAGRDSVLTLMVRYGLLVVPFLVALLPRAREEMRPFLAVDFFYSLMLFLLVLVLVLGSFTVKMISQSNYPMALAQTLMGIAGVLFALSWFWDPRGGFAGGGQLMSRYLLSVGLPFERWLQNLAALAEREHDPLSFLRQALEQIASLPWVVGGHWQAPGGEGKFGTSSRHFAEFTFHGVTLVLYTRWVLSPALILHVRLLTQLLGYFFESKQREQEQKCSAYTQAIYETGARLTHDVKNLLQSMKSLCAAVETSEPDQAAALQALMQRQLPQVAQRLQMTLDKLTSPRGDSEQAERIDSGSWWDALCQRYAQDGIEFGTVDGPQDDAILIPRELFDSVADNLLQNALDKRRLERGLNIRVDFSRFGGGCLTVCDDGAQLPETQLQRLFNLPMASETGLGVGLLHAARQARQAGYGLKLIVNRAGRVCFELTEK